MKAISSVQKQRKTCQTGKKALKVTEAKFELKLVILNLKTAVVVIA